MNKIPDNLIEIANDVWAKIPYGVRDAMKQSNWMIGFCEGYKKCLTNEQPSSIGQEEDEKDKLIEQLKKDKIELMSVLDSLSNGEAMNVIRESEGVYSVIFKKKETKGNS